MKRARWGWFILFAALNTCGREPLEPVMGEVESILVSPAISTVSIGSNLELEAQVLDATGATVADRQVHWTSENSEIATVSPSGVVTANKVGTVQVAASTGGHSGLALVTVTTIPVASVHVAPGNKALFVEESFQFTAEARDANGDVLPGRPITWASNNESVAAVSSTGVVTALSPGGAIITATSEGRTSPASVTVSAIPVAAIELSPTQLTLIDGQTGQLQAQPVDASGGPLVGRVILWFTDNASVATVSATGLVTAQSPGDATITATTEGRSATTSVTVTAPLPNAVILTPAQVVVEEGATQALTAQVLDGLGRDLPNATVTYSTSNPAVATVSAGGVVTGVGPGKATITGTSGGQTGTAEITVTPTPAASVVVTPTQSFIAIGRKITLTAEAYSATGQLLAGRTVSWSSSTASVASVSPGGEVTGLAAGNTVVFASVDGVLGWADVNVIPVPVASVTVSPATLTLPIGQSAPLTATLMDASGNTLSGRVVTWASSDMAVATVSTTGAVTGVAAGTATITATSEGQTGSATATVALPGVKTITITPSSVTISPLSTFQLTATVRDASGAIITASVTWSTSNALIAAVSQNGRVSGFLPGTATITAKSGSATATATITVQ